MQSLRTELTGLDALSDEELLKVHLQGNERGLSILMKRYQHSVVTYTYRMLGNYDDAVDIAQETFVRVHKYGSSFVEHERFSSWLYAIARNLSLTELGKTRRRVTMSLHDAFGYEDSDVFEVPDDSYRADTAVDTNAVTQAVQQALMKIHPNYREMVVLRDIQELSYEEISSITNTEMGTVKSRLSRGRAALQRLLQHVYSEVFAQQGSTNE
jgi:RNA polymerase sigma-70 factor, ECF subfamily